MKHTKNLNLNKVDYGTQEWHGYLNDNFDILDEAIAESNSSDSVINSVEPSTHKAGRLWVDKIGQDDKVIKGKYKIDNGTDYNEMHFETEAELVKCKDGKNVEEKITEINTNTEQEITEFKQEVNNQYEDLTNEIGDKNNLKTTNKENLISAINEVFTCGNNVKSNTVDALLQVDRSLQINKNSKWENIIQNITTITTGKNVAKGVFQAGTSSNNLFIRLNFTPNTILFYKNTEDENNIILKHIGINVSYLKGILNIPCHNYTLSSDFIITSKNEAKLRVNGTGAISTSIYWIAYR